MICRTIKIGPDNYCTASINGCNIICTSGNDTQIANSGNPYLWSSGETKQTIEVNKAVTYVVKVTQGGSCPASSSVNVSQSAINLLPIYND